MISFKEWRLKDNQKKVNESIEKAGTKITKEKLIEAIRKSNEGDFYFAQEANSAMAVVRLLLS